jgi:3-deoxy-D-manno-octulosonic acid kinase
MNDATGIAPTASPAVHIDERIGLIHDANIDFAAALALFDAVGEVQEGRGRGAIRRVDAPIGRVVVRHYRRGGLIARLSRDWFIWAGAEATRPFREFRITQLLHERGLPVPEVVAGRFVRDGFGYRADLATREIPGARTLAERLSAEAVDIDWAALGALIARLHAAGLWHADLNAHNLLFDTLGRGVVIDLDRARFVAPFAPTLQGNVDRLARSLRKLGHRALVAGAPWTAFRRAYDQAVQAAAAAR